jgi:hypothetical protein
MRKRLTNWWLLQRLAWRALWTEPAVLARALVGASLHHEGAKAVDDAELMRQAFQDKLSGKSNQQSAALRELQRRHGT